MRYLRRAALGLIVLSALAETPQRWTHLASPNFQIAPPGTEGEARETRHYFDQVGGFFSEAISHSKEKWPRVRIVAFNNAKEYEPYRYNRVADAYYYFNGSRDYIVMSHTGAESARTAIHEYV